MKRASVKSHLRKNFPYRRPLNEEGLLQGIIDGRLFGYVQCAIEVPEHLQRIYERNKKRGNKTKRAKNRSNRKDTKLLKCGSAVGGNYTEPMRQ